MTVHATAAPVPARPSRHEQSQRSARVYHERAEQEVCVRCGEPAFPGRRMCFDHLEHKSELVRERRRRAIEEGHCRRCLRAPAESPGGTCAICRERERLEANSRRERRRRDGRCGRCGGQVDAGARECAECRVTGRRASRAAYRRARGAGRCHACGKPCGERWRCVSCSQRFNATLRRLIERRVSAGACATCGSPRGADGTGVRCRRCQDAINTSENARRAARRARGLCVRCLKPAHGAGSRCLACKAKERKPGARPLHCANCHREGHNRRTCPFPVETTTHRRAS